MSAVERWGCVCGCDWHGDHLACDAVCKNSGGCQHPIGVEITAATEVEADGHIHGPECWNAVKAGPWIVGLLDEHEFMHQLPPHHTTVYGPFFDLESAIACARAMSSDPNEAVVIELTELALAASSSEGAQQ